MTCLIVSLLALLLCFLVGEDDEQALEDGDEVDEQLGRVHDVVLVSASRLLDDGLGVEHNEAAHHGQSDVHVGLEEQPGAPEEVEDGEPEEAGEAGEQRAAQVEPVASRREQGRQGEAGEHNAGAQQRLDHNSRINHDGHVQERSEVAASQEGKASEQRKTLVLILAVIRSCHQTNEGCNSSNSCEKSRSDERTEHVRIRAGRGGNACQHEGAINILQMALNIRLYVFIETPRKPFKAYAVHDGELCASEPYFDVFFRANGGKATGYSTIVGD